MRQQTVFLRCGTGNWSLSAAVDNRTDGSRSVHAQKRAGRLDCGGESASRFVTGLRALTISIRSVGSVRRIVCLLPAGDGFMWGEAPSAVRPAHFDYPPKGCPTSRRLCETREPVLDPAAMRVYILHYFSECPITRILNSLLDMASEANARVLAGFLDYLRIEKGLARLSISGLYHRHRTVRGVSGKAEAAADDRPAE